MGLVCVLRSGALCCVAMFYDGAVCVASLTVFLLAHYTLWLVWRGFVLQSAVLCFLCFCCLCCVILRCLFDGHSAGPSHVLVCVARWRVVLRLCGLSCVVLCFEVFLCCCSLCAWRCVAAAVICVAKSCYVLLQCVARCGLDVGWDAFCRWSSCSVEQYRVPV